MVVKTDRPKADTQPSEVTDTMKYLTALALVVVMAAPAGAMQTEVKQREIQWKREALARWHRQEARERVEETTETDDSGSGPAPVPTYSGGDLYAFQVAEYARGAGFPESLISTMVAIAYRESGFDPTAVNPSSGACGLWQMYPCPGPHALDPATNAAMAYQKYVGSGYDLDPWGY